MYLPQFVQKELRIVPGKFLQVFFLVISGFYISGWHAIEDFDLLPDGSRVQWVEVCGKEHTHVILKLYFFGDISSLVLGLSSLQNTLNIHS